MYGCVPDDIAKTHEFFGKVKDYYTKLWSRFKRDKVLLTDIYKRRITLNEKDFYPSKLFNYMIQSLETERNIVILKSLLKVFKLDNRFCSKSYFLVINNATYFHLY